MIIMIMSTITATLLGLHFHKPINLQKFKQSYDISTLITNIKYCIKKNKFIGITTDHIA